jgi:hypothetical protein
MEVLPCLLRCRIWIEENGCLSICFKKIMRFFLIFLLISKYCSAEVLCKTKLQKYYMLKVYDITLCKESKTGYEDIFNTQFSIKLKYRTSSSSDWIGSRSINEILKNYKLTEQELKSYTEYFKGFFPSVKNGDEILMEFNPQKTAKFYYNGKFFREITDSILAVRMANIWLHPNSTFKDTRDFLFTNE